MRLLKIIIISIAFLILICTEAAKLYSFNFSNINIENRCFIVEGNKDLQKVIEPDKTSLDFDSLNIEYRQAMRKWVAKIGQIAKAKKSNFLIIPQNCSLLFTDNGEPDGNLCYDFISVIDGVGQEGINFGNIRYNKATNEINRDKLTSQLNIGTKSGLTVLAVDYCNDENKINITQEYNEENNFIGFQATSIDLLEIPAIIPLNENPYDIRNLSSAQNFLFLLDTEYFKDKEEYILSLSETNYDILVIDAFFKIGEMLTNKDLKRLKRKAGGGSRLVISYLSIGEAEDYRYYWNQDYSKSLPSWILEENPEWKGNYIVEYWNEEWQDIIAAGKGSYLNRIIDAGFDGVYLDIVDGFENFE
jgi:cysteinyl-tRNA synthetase, unknown class